MLAPLFSISLNPLSKYHQHFIRIPHEPLWLISTFEIIMLIYRCEKLGCYSFSWFSMINISCFTWYCNIINDIIFKRMTDITTYNWQNCSIDRCNNLWSIWIIRTIRYKINRFCFVNRTKWIGYKCPTKIFCMKSSLFEWTKFSFLSTYSISSIV